MKKFYLLPLLVLLFTACSSDDSILDSNTEASNKNYQQRAAGINFDGPYTPVLTCLRNLKGEVSLDVSAGLGNPVINFIFRPPFSTPAVQGFRATVEVQALSDCDDIASGTGTVFVFGTTAVISNIAANNPVINILPSQLPSCYKWRTVLSSATTTCVSYSPWYEQPLF